MDDGKRLSGVPLGRSGADRFMNHKIKNIGGGFGGDGQKIGPGKVPSADFFL